MNLPQSDGVGIAVTGTAWMGKGVGSVQSAIERLLSSADDEVKVVVYEITAGAREFLDRIQICLARGIPVTIIINRYHEKPFQLRNRLENLAERFSHFRILNFQPKNQTEDLHAKIIVVDRREALVGSANLTWRGLVGNHELAVLVSGPSASTIAKLVDRLCRDPRTAPAGR